MHPSKRLGVALFAGGVVVTLGLAGLGHVRRAVAQGKWALGTTDTPSKDEALMLRGVVATLNDIGKARADLKAKQEETLADLAEITSRAKSTRGVPADSPFKFNFEIGKWEVAPVRTSS